MQYLGKGKALRPGSGGAALVEAALLSPSLVGSEAEEVYLVPGMEEGISGAELRVQSRPVQILVMSTWFRANFRQVSGGSALVEIGLAQAIGKEFDGHVVNQNIAALADGLLTEAPVWEAIGEEASDATVSSSALLSRIEEVEKALAKLGPQHGAIGHNNPPQGPLSVGELASAYDAIAKLREQASSTRPDRTLTQRATAALTSAAATIGRWLLKRAEIGIDEVIKKAAGAAGILGIADVMDAWQKINFLIETLGRWISQIPA